MASPFSYDVICPAIHRQMFTALLLASKKFFLMFYFVVIFIQSLNIKNFLWFYQNNLQIYSDQFEKTVKIKSDHQFRLSSDNFTLTIDQIRSDIGGSFIGNSVNSEKNVTHTIRLDVVGRQAHRDMDEYIIVLGMRIDKSISSVK